MGRKNYLFCYSEGGADAACIISSIIETCRANNLKPNEYLEYVFNAIGNKDLEKLPDDLIEPLLPYNKNLPQYLKLKK